MMFFKETSKKMTVLGILSLFLLKGFFLVVLIPFFQSPDEQVHYGTVQHWAESETKSLRLAEGRQHDPTDISSFNFSDELTHAAQVTNFDDIKFENKNTQKFVFGNSSGPNEGAFQNLVFSKYITKNNSAVSGTWSWYYLASSWIERGLLDSSIFTRMFAVRFFSVVLGSLVVLFAFFTFRKIRFSTLESLLLTALLAFQPMLAATAAQINIDIALVLSFSIFIFAGCWILRDGVHWKNSSLLILSAFLGFFAKGPGIVLVAATAPLLSYAVWVRFGQHTKEWLREKKISPKVFWFSLLSALVFIGILLWNTIPTSYITTITNAGTPSQYSSQTASLLTYADKTMKLDAFRWSAVSYWGNFGWLDTRIGDKVFNLIWYIEIIGLVGLILFLLPNNLFSRIHHTRFFKYFLRDKKSFLPEKRFIFFLLLLSLALELAIRFYDWRVFDATGKILIGTPGRYFLPNVIAHITLLATGLGFFCRSKTQFHWLLKSLLVLTILLNFYAIFAIILPRYYL